MTSFDFLRSARPDWLQRVLEIRVPQRLHSALIGLLASLTVIGGAWAIEQHRLAGARAIEAEYRVRFEVSERVLLTTKVFYDQVQALIALDRRVRGIVASGDADARRIAEIANNLPDHAWLTSISRDPSGISLEGRAENLGVLSGVMRGLMRARNLHNPTLTSAQLISDRSSENLIKYAMHIEGSRQ